MAKRKKPAKQVKGAGKRRKKVVRARTARRTTGSTRKKALRKKRRTIRPPATAAPAPTPDAIAAQSAPPVETAAPEMEAT